MANSQPPCLSSNDTQRCSQKNLCAPSVGKTPVKISVITPSIRPDGLAVAWETLSLQSFDSFEWLPRLSLVGGTPDLCYQMNRALDEAQGEIVVFLQDFIELQVDALERMWAAYKRDKTAAWTAPVGKVISYNDEPDYDWRLHREQDEVIEFHEWEIDWGMAPTELMRNVMGFEEKYDEGFGWENVDLAYRMHKEGVPFKLDPSNPAIAFDHDAVVEHPFRRMPNQALWETRKGVIDLMYEDVQGDDSN